jgi:hypothetical protein
LEPELRELESLLFPELELKLLECWMLLDQFELAVAVFSGDEGVELLSGEGGLSFLDSVLICSLLKLFCLDGECSLILAGFPADRVM